MARVKWLVDPAWRGVGLGTALLTQFISIARENGLRYLSTMLISDLESLAVSTLQHLGFSRFDVPGYGADPEGKAHDMTYLVLKI